MSMTEYDPGIRLPCQNHTSGPSTTRAATLARRSRRWAAIVLGLVVLQVFLGYTGFDVPAVGLIHGLNAFALFSCAILAARRAHPTDQTAMAATP